MPPSPSRRASGGRRSSTTRTRSTPRSGRGRLFGGLALAVLAPPLLFVAAVRLGAWGPLPDRDELAGWRHANASLVLASDGRLLGKYWRENRTSVPVDTLPEALLEALVATEDARFWRHDGVDWTAFGRVALGLVSGNEAAGGGSTLAQQLAKNLYGRPGGFLALPAAKVRESLIGRRLEAVHGKRGVLELYLNTVPFGEDCYGIESASWRFFNKSAHDLRVEECAVLVGLLKANTTYSPRRHPEASRGRRDVVLGLMARHGYLSDRARDSLRALPLRLDYTRRGPHDGLAPHFRARVREEAEALLANREGPGGRPWDLERDGLRIHTTLDVVLQGYAEAAVGDHLPGLQRAFAADAGSRSDAEGLARAVEATDRYRRARARGLDDQAIREAFAERRSSTWFHWDGSRVVEGSPLDSVRHHREQLQVGFVVTDPATGDVLAWVGGAEHRRYPYDHARAGRPAGSTLKPLLVAAALEQGRDPCAWLSAERVAHVDRDGWAPRNADGHYEGYWSMPGALAHSVNTATVQLWAGLDPDSVARTMARFGVAEAWGPEPARALGSGNVSAAGLAEAYAVFARDGRTRPLRLVRRIETAEGHPIVVREPAPEREVVPASAARMTRRMLEWAVDSGTAAALRGRHGLRGDLAGKTGTTQDHADGWFVGFSPGLLGAVWVGADDPSLHFSSLRHGQGAAMALPVWAGFWRRAQADGRYRARAAGAFEPLPAEEAERLDCPFWVPEPPAPEGFWERLFGPSEGPRRDRRPPRREGFFERLFGRDGRR